MGKTSPTAEKTKAESPEIEKGRTKKQGRLNKTKTAAQKQNILPKTQRK